MRLLLALTLCMAISVPAFAMEPEEEDKVNAMLHALQTSNVTFVRNNTKLSGERAVAHLQGKWKNRRDVVHTAEDFIKRIASKSQQSGKAYVILFPNGTFQPAAQWFTERLKDIESGKIPIPPRGGIKGPMTNKKVYDNSDTGSYIAKPTPRKE